MSSSTGTQSAIIWPGKYLPGRTDNFATNEVIASDMTASQIWTFLADVSKWASYYSNVSQIRAPSSGPILRRGDEFAFSTFGFPPLDCRVEESVAPTESSAGRIAWSARLEGDAETAVDVYHAWLIEDLDLDRVRILTQESQIGLPAKKLSGQRPNRMILGHQDWCEGLVRAVKGEGIPEVTNLNSVEK